MLQELMTVQEVADYLRIKERKVYDLLAQKRIPCTRVTGKWLFPRAQIDSWLKQNTELQTEDQTAMPDPPQLLVGSNDLLLEWALRENQYPFAIQTTGSMNGLKLFIEKQAMVCGLHILAADGKQYNIPTVLEKFNKQAVVLIHWARRQQGIVVAKGNPLKIQSPQDLTKCRIIDRQVGSGSHILLDCVLQQKKLDKSDLLFLPQPARCESDVGEAIISGQADAGIAIQAVAKQYNLEFIPLLYEQYDLLIRHQHYFDQPFQRLLAFTQEAQFKEKAQQLTGYDLSETGQVRLNLL